MFKVDLSKTDFTSVETYENTVKEAEMELENRRKELEEYKTKGKERIPIRLLAFSRRPSVITSMELSNRQAS